MVKLSLSSNLTLLTSKMSIYCVQSYAKLDYIVEILFTERFQNLRNVTPNERFQVIVM